MRERARVVVAEGRVAAIENAKADPIDIHLPEGSILTPGFVDAQVNGGGGVLFNDDPSVAALRQISEAHARFGTTALMATLITDIPAKRERAIGAVAEAIRANIAGIVGVHLEGPFLSTKRPGVHPPGLIQTMTADDIPGLAALGSTGRTLVTLAPEAVPDGWIAALVDRGVGVSAGHSEASEARMADAVRAGLSGATHLFNAMSQLTPREGGVVGAVLAEPRLTAGIIADGFHVSVAALRAALAAKGPRGLMLVSDAMPTVGGDIGAFDLLGTPVAREGERLITSSGTLAGAHLTMAGALRHMVRGVGAPLADALTMATATPARFLGLEATHGHVATGRRADLVALDPALNVIAVWQGGRQIVSTPR